MTDRVRALSYAWYESFTALQAAISPDARRLRIAKTEKRIVGDLAGYRVDWYENAGTETWAIAEEQTPDGPRLHTARVSNPAVLASPEFLSWTPIREYLTAVG